MNYNLNVKFHFLNLQWIRNFFPKVKAQHFKQNQANQAASSQTKLDSENRFHVDRFSTKFWRFCWKTSSTKRIFRIHARREESFQPCSGNRNNTTSMLKHDVVRKAFIFICSRAEMKIGWNLSAPYRADALYGARFLPVRRSLRRMEPELSLIHIWRCRRIERCRSRWSQYH